MKEDNLDTMDLAFMNSNCVRCIESYSDVFLVLYASRVFSKIASFTLPVSLIVR